MSPEQFFRRIVIFFWFLILTFPGVILIGQATFPELLPDHDHKPHWVSVFLFTGMSLWCLNLMPSRRRHPAGRVGEWRGQMVANFPGLVVLLAPATLTVAAYVQAHDVNQRLPLINYHQSVSTAGNTKITERFAEKYPDKFTDEHLTSLRRNGWRVSRGLTVDAEIDERENIKLTVSDLDHAACAHITAWFADEYLYPSFLGWDLDEDHELVLTRLEAEKVSVNGGRWMETEAPVDEKAVRKMCEDDGHDRIESAKVEYMLVPVDDPQVDFVNRNK